MSPSTDRQTYRALVAQVADKARAILPQDVNGRLESAVKLVLNHDIEVLDDGSIPVGSSSDPAKTYHLVGTSCECQDVQHAQAPQGWCQHRIAAGIRKRVHELLPHEPAPATPAAPLPEAPASCNVYVTINGHKVQVTLRDSDEQRMLAQLRTILDQYPAPAAPAKVEGWCATHDVQMRFNPGKEGKPGWWSHKTAEGHWCKGGRP